MHQAMISSTMPTKSIIGPEQSSILAAIITSGLSSPAKCLLLQKETVEQRRYLACVFYKLTYRYACDPSESVSTLQQQALSVLLYQIITYV